MSKLGDLLFGRILRRLKKGESLSDPGRRCSRCNKDMSHYSFMFEPEADEVCEECDADIRREKALEQWKNAPLPEYDIDAIIGPPGRKAHQVVSDLNRVFYSVICPEKSLLEPEIVIRDFCEFAQFLGHDMSYILGLNRGDQLVLRGQRAFRAIGAAKMDHYIAEFLKVAEAHGLKFPTPLPDPWLDHLGCIDEELMSVLEKESRRLRSEIDTSEDHPSGDYSQLLLEYVVKNMDLLRQRKPKNQ